MRLTRVLRDASRVASSTKRHSNLPDSYIKRTMEQIEYTNREGPQFTKGKVYKKENFYFGEHRPWTKEFYEENLPGSFHQEVLVEPIKDWSFFKGDVVELLSGPDKGKKGHINYIVEERNWIYVGGLNCKYDLIGKSDKFAGMIMKVSKPLLVTRDVALIDPSDNKPTTVEWRYTEEGERVRVSTRTQRILPIPLMDQETVDYKTKDTYKEQPKDTVEEHLTQVTFQPTLATFQMHLMKSVGITEEKVPKKSFWYYLEERV